MQWLSYNHQVLISSIFITATDTGLGKTYFSEKIIKDLIDRGFYKKEEIAYYKPVQCGEEIVDGKKQTDFSYIKDSTGVAVYHSYFFKHPCSPHYAAELEGKKVELENILEDYKDLKSKYKFIIVEGAGGVAVPLNDCDLVSDLIKAMQIPIVLVTRPDLGTINHTLLSLEHLIFKQGLYDQILALYVRETSACSNEYSINNSEFLEKQRENSIVTICKNMNVRIFDIDLLRSNVAT